MGQKHSVELHVPEVAPQETGEEEKGAQYRERAEAGSGQAVAWRVMQCWTEAATQTLTWVLCHPASHTLPAMRASIIAACNHCVQQGQRMQMCPGGCEGQLPEECS